MAVKDILGQRFGKLLVTERHGSTKGTTTWLCVCECGNTRIIAGTGLRAGRRKSCGCSSPKFTSKRLTTHGKSKNRIYGIWQGIIFRCSNKSRGNERKNYFEKGIRVCEEWMKFENFLADMGEPENHLTLDRKEGDKGYSFDNCRWATMKQQANNKSGNRVIEYEGKVATVAEWAQEIGIKPNTLEYRLLRGWDIHRAITTPIQIRTYA